MSKAGGAAVDVDIVPLTSSDLPALLALERAQSVALSGSAALSAALVASPPSHNPRDHAGMAHLAFGARAEDGQLLGYALLALQPFDAELEAILIASEARRQGLARRLLDCVITTARHRQRERLLLEVRAGNQAAIALYRAVGFQHDGIRKGYYPPAAYPVTASPSSPADAREDAWLMSLILS